MEISDLSGLGAPLKKLVSVISKGVGAVSARYLIASEAKGKAIEIDVIANAVRRATGNDQLAIAYDSGRVQVSSTQALLDDEIRSGVVASSRATFVETKRQRNIEQITSTAAIELAHEKDVSDTPVDEDWITRFFEYAESISSAQMQMVWARLLAGEIKKPGSYSVRTLEFVKNLSQSEASHINFLADLAVSEGETMFIPWIDHQAFVTKGFGPRVFFELAEIGVLNPSELNMTIFAGNATYSNFTVGEVLLNIDKSASAGPFNFGVLKFSTVGKEIVQLLTPSGDEVALEAIGRHFARLGCVCKIGKIMARENDQVTYEDRPPLSAN